MFLITTAYQRARSRREPDKPGRIVFRIAQKESEESEWVVRAVSSDILGDKETVVENNRAEIIRHIRIIYAIIEERCGKYVPFTIDDVADDFRQALRGEMCMNPLVERANQDFPLRADIVSVGNEYKRDFRFVYPSGESTAENLLGYITNLALKAKSEGKSTRFRSYSSTRASLERYLGDVDISLRDISKSFLIDYSKWLKESDIADSTQSFYLRTLRSILNHAREEGQMDCSEDLFIGLNTRVIFSKPDDEPSSFYLPKEVLRRISGAELSGDREVGIVRDMFMFGFYCRGMELTDVVSLTKSSIAGDKLIYRRRSNGHSKVIPLDKSARAIISKYLFSDGDYLFPLYDMYRGLQQYSVTNIVRRKIKQLGNAVGFPQLTFSMNITTWKHLMADVSVSEMLIGRV